MADGRGLDGTRRFGSGPLALLVVSLAGVVAAGCGEDRVGGAAERDSRSGGGGAQRHLPDSVRRIESPEAAWSQPARLKMAREIRGAAISVGSTEGAGTPVLSSIRDVAPGGDGRILVLDGSEARVIVLDRNGRVVGRLGGRGAGPGELTTPDRVEASPNGDILVLERRPAATHRWRDGEYVGAVRLTRSVSGETPESGPGVTELADWGPVLPGGRAVRLIRLDVSDPSSTGSAVYAADSAGRIASPGLTWSTPGTLSRLPEVFGAHRSWAAGAGSDGEARFTVARGDRYELRLHDAAGTLRTVIRRQVEPRPVTDALRERALDRFVEEAGRAGAPPGMTRELRNRLPVAETLPVTGDLWHSATDGRLWVGLVGPGTPGEPPSVIREYDVYGADGRYLGAVGSPPGFELHRVEGKLLYGSWKDSLDVPGVRVYRLLEESRMRSERADSGDATRASPSPE